MGDWGAQVDGVHHLSWASSLGVCTGLNLKVSTALDQTGNISRRGLELTDQHPDPAVDDRPVQLWPLPLTQSPGEDTPDTWLLPVTAPPSQAPGSAQKFLSCCEFPRLPPARSTPRHSPHFTPPQAPGQEGGGSPKGSIQVWVESVLQVKG